MDNVIKQLEEIAKRENLRDVNSLEQAMEKIKNSYFLRIDVRTGCVIEPYRFLNGVIEIDKILNQIHNNFDDIYISFNLGDGNWLNNVINLKYKNNLNKLKDLEEIFLPIFLKNRNNSETN